MKYFVQGGYRPDPPHKRLLQKSSRLLLGTTPTFPPISTIRPLEVKIRELPLDQNRTSGCGGHGTGAQISLAFVAMGQILFPGGGSQCASPKSIYAITRTEELFTPGSITDSGIIPSDLMTAISKFGVRAIQAPSPQGFNSDIDQSNVNQEEDFDQLEEDGEKIVVGEYRIDEVAADYLDQVCLSIAGGIPVGLGIYVDTAFESWQAGDKPLADVDLNDPNGGGHWITLVGYSESGGVFELLNSWGPGWGDLGHILVTAAWMKKAVSDCYAMNVARKAA